MGLHGSEDNLKKFDMQVNDSRKVPTQIPALDHVRRVRTTRTDAKKARVRKHVLVHFDIRVQKQLFSLRDMERLRVL